MNNAENKIHTSATVGQRVRSALLTLVLLPLFFVLGISLIPAIPILLVSAIIYRICIGCLVRLLWFPKSKYLLVVHSDSPVWTPYIDELLLPTINGHAVALNWSKRKSWSQLSLAVHVFQAFVGSSNHVPSVVLFDRWWKPQVYRYWKPFKAYKHGKPQEVDDLTKKLKSDLDHFVQSRSRRK